MPRLTSGRRLTIMSRALAHAEALSAQGEESVHLSEVAKALGEDLADVRESLEPLQWLEFHAPEGIVDLLDALTLEDDWLTVESMWWRRLGALSPGEAARLYVRAASAASLDTGQTVHLGSAMAKLRRIIGEVTVVEGNPPPHVKTLREARDTKQSVVVLMEGRDRTMVTAGVTYSVVAVYRAGSEWMVTLGAPSAIADSDVPAGGVGTIPVDRIVTVVPSVESVEEREVNPSVLDIGDGIEVEIQHLESRAWVLDRTLRLESTSMGNGVQVSRLSVRSIPELKTLLLRLGPDTSVLAPPGLIDLQSRAAREILALYS